MTAIESPMTELTDPMCLRPSKAAALLEAAPWRRWGVIGDSLSLGVGDPAAGYEHAPWHARVARALRVPQPDLTTMLCAEVGATTAVALREQLPRLIDFGPDLVHLPSAANDIWRRQPDFDRIDEELRVLVDPFVGAGVTVTMFSLGSAYDVASIPGFGERVRRLNQVIFGLADDLGVVVVDTFDHPVMRRSDLLSADRLHFSAVGQAVLATEYVKRIAAELGGAE